MNTHTPSALLATCPKCGEPLHFPRPLRLGQAIECPYCDAALEVTYSNPLELLPALEDDEEDELWEYEYEEEEEDEGW